MGNIKTDVKQIEDQLNFIQYRVIDLITLLKKLEIEEQTIRETVPVRITKLVEELLRK